MNSLSAMHEVWAAIAASPGCCRLLAVSVEVAVLAVAVWCLIRVLRIRSARVCSLLWILVLAKGLFGLAFGAPLEVAVLRLTEPARPSQSATAAISAEDLARQEAEMQRALREAESSAGATAASAPNGTGGTQPSSPAMGIAQVPRPSTPSRLSGLFASIGRFSFAAHAAGLLTAVWLAGVLWALLATALDLRRIRDLARASGAPSEDLLAVFRAEAARLGIARVPALSVCTEVESPALAGFLRPTVLAPAWLAETADPDQLRWMLAHELMHYKQKDTVGLLVRRAAQVALWFHPAVWWAGRQWEEAMERACDRALIAGEADARHYAEQLHGVLKSLMARRSRVRVVTGLFATRTQIGKRIAALLTDSLAMPARLSPSSATLVALFAAAALSFGVGVHRPAVAQGVGIEKPGNYSVLFTTGVRAEVLGLAMYPRQDEQCWSPSGEELAGVPDGHEVKGSRVYPGPGETEIARKIYVRLSNLPASGDVKVAHKIVSGSGDSYLTATMQRFEMDITATFPRATKTGTVQLGVAAGPWETRIDSDATSTGMSMTRGGKPIAVSFGRPFREGGEVCVVVTHGDVDDDTRVVGSDEHGSQFVFRLSRSTRVGWVRQWTYACRIPEGDTKIGKLELQIRPYEWREIGGIALEPRPSQGADGADKGSVAASAQAPEDRGLLYAVKRSADSALALEAVHCVPVKDKSWAVLMRATNSTSQTQYLGVDVSVNLKGFLGGGTHRAEIFTLAPDFAGELRREFELVPEPFSLSRPNEVHLQVARPKDAKYREEKNMGGFLPPDAEMLFETYLTLPTKDGKEASLIPAAAQGPLRTESPNLPPAVVRPAVPRPAVSPTNPSLKAFYEAYRLEDGELLRRIPTPFLPERAEYLRLALGRDDLPDLVRFGWGGDLTDDGEAWRSGMPPSLADILPFCTDLARYEFEGPRDLLAIQVPGDWIVRKGTRQENLLKALEGVLKKDLERDIRFEKRRVEREALVAHGTFAPGPRPSPESRNGVPQIHVYVDNPDREAGRGGASGTLSAFLRSIGDRLGIPVADEIQKTDATIEWTVYGDAVDTSIREDPAKFRKVLDNLSKQTSLQFTLDKRMVDVWFVTEGDAGPAGLLTLEANPAVGLAGAVASPAPADDRDRRVPEAEPFGLPMPGQKQPEQIVVEAYQAPSQVRIDGQAVELAAVLTPDGGCWRPDGFRMNPADLHLGQHALTTIQGYLSKGPEGAKKPEGGRFGLVLLFDKELDTVNRELQIEPRSAPSIQSAGSFYLRQTDDSTRRWVVVQKVESFGEVPQQLDLYANVPYGPMLAERLDIPADAANKELAFQGQTYRFTVRNLTDHAAGRDTKPEGLEVIQEVTKGAMLRGYKIRAMFQGGQLMDPWATPGLARTRGVWGCAGEPISPDNNLDRFVYCGWAVQPILWRGIRLTPRGAAAATNPTVGLPDAVGAPVAVPAGGPTAPAANPAVPAK